MYDFCSGSAAPFTQALFILANLKHWKRGRIKLPFEKGSVLMWKSLKSMQQLFAAWVQALLMQPASNGGGACWWMLCWEPKGKKKVCKSLLQDCCWWEGCEIRASTVVLTHSQCCTERQLCVSVMCSRCLFVASALALDVEGCACGYVILPQASWQCQIFTIACLTIKQKCQCIVTVSAEWNITLVCWCGIKAALQSAILCVHLKEMACSFQQEGSRGTRQSCP